MRETPRKATLCLGDVNCGKATVGFFNLMGVFHVFIVRGGDIIAQVSPFVNLYS